MWAILRPYTGGDGQPIGFQIDICKLIVSAIQTQLGLPTLDVKYQTVNSQNRVVLVQNGTVDLECGSTTNNQARARDVAFSVTTYMEEDRMAVRANSGIRNLRDLSGKTVVATTGTTAIQHLRRHERAAGLNWTDLYGKDHADSFLMLESGRADAWVLDQGVLRATIASSRNPGAYTVTGEPFNTEPIAIMFRKDDADLKKVVDGTIRKMDASGDMKTLWSKWFLQPIPPRGIRMGMEPPEALMKLWAQPNDLPMESYAAR
jgi:glutamate/aspartate transport system substrate-binding protein